MMHKKLINSILIALVCIILIGCKENDLIPGEVSLSIPTNNAACLQATSTIGALASVSFSWNPATNADSYQLVIKNLNTQTINTYTTSSTVYAANLTINMPYSWSVVANNSSGQTTSYVWKFYLSDKASSSYAPFPADLTTPVASAMIDSNGLSTVSISFQWTGNDPDNDIATYNLYCDNKDASTKVVSFLTASNFTQTLTSGGIYHWKVETIDKMGNCSISKVNSFQIK